MASTERDIKKRIEKHLYDNFSDRLWDVFFSFPKEAIALSQGIGEEVMMFCDKDAISESEKHNKLEMEAAAKEFSRLTLQDAEILYRSLKELSDNWGAHNYRLCGNACNPVARNNMVLMFSQILENKRKDHEWDSKTRKYVNMIL